jgi:hypothetical protein
VVTSSDFHFIFFLELTHKNLNGCALEAWHGCGVPHFMGLHTKLA